MYVLTRRDLNKKQQAVQSGHAVAEYLLNHPETSWDNGTLVYLAVSNEEELRFWANKLNNEGLVWKGFQEPDINNELTALATVAEGSLFNSLCLL